MSNYKN